MQTLYDAWQDKRRPVAKAGFGLPELFALPATAVGRPARAPMPRPRASTTSIVRLAPWPQHATETAIRAIARRLGTGRALEVYLDALVDRVIHHKPDGQ